MWAVVLTIGPLPQSTSEGFDWDVGNLRDTCECNYPSFADTSCQLFKGKKTWKKKEKEKEKG